MTGQDIPAQGHDVFNALLLHAPDLERDFLTGGIDAGEVRYRRHPRFFLDFTGQVQRERTGPSAGTIGDGYKTGVQGGNVQGGFADILHRSELLGRKDLKGEMASVCGQPGAYLHGITSFVRNSPDSIIRG